jgi:hypothetical protein
MDRRTFLRKGGLVAGALAFAGPLMALRQREALGLEVEPAATDRLIALGDLALPPGFRYRVISSEGDLMSDGQPTPSKFDGMGVFAAPGGGSVLIRNHENDRGRREIPVVVPDGLRWDADKEYNGGCTKLVVNASGVVEASYAVLGGTTTNCAGGVMPWGSWLTCEESIGRGPWPHGFIFEVDAYGSGPGAALPVWRAGRFIHEAVAWHAGALYETEDRHNAALYRFIPDVRPTVPGQLWQLGGTLQALRIVGNPNLDTRKGWPVGTQFSVDWVTITDPNPSNGETCDPEAHALGAALFDRTEGIWSANGRVYFDCTEGGAAGMGQIWQLDPAAGFLRLIYESPGATSLANPDNMTTTPGGHLLLCENAPGKVQRIRGLTPAGTIYDFARADVRKTEFAGVCFNAATQTLFVNQQGDPGEAAVTYAIWGPWGSAAV